MTLGTQTPATAKSCPFCGGNVVSRLVVETIPYVTPQGEVSLMAEVPYESCSACGYEGFGAAGEQARTEAVYRHVGRLCPWEIVAMREHLGLSQAEFAGWLGVGRASLERWERGAHMQNQSMDNLMLLLSIPANKQWLDRRRLESQKVSACSGKIVSLERFRALQSRDTDDLAARRAIFRLRRSV